MELNEAVRLHEVNKDSEIVIHGKCIHHLRIEMVVYNGLFTLAAKHAGGRTGGNMIIATWIMKLISKIINEIIINNKNN